MTNRTHPAPAPQATPAETSNADKARVLMALLDGGGTAGQGVPAARLRDWARDLVETVERSATRAPGQKDAPLPPEPPRPAPLRLFTTPAPILVDRALAAPMAAPPAAPRVAVPPRLTLGAPMPHVPPRPQAAVAGGPAMLARPEVDRLIAATVDPVGDPVGLGREHPAIIAMTLIGKPTLQQAAALRALPGGQMRAVHRALRQLEARPV